MGRVDDDHLGVRVSSNSSSNATNSKKRLVLIVRITTLAVMTISMITTPSYPKQILGATTYEQHEKHILIRYIGRCGISMLSTGAWKVSGIIILDTWSWTVGRGSLFLRAVMLFISL